MTIPKDAGGLFTYFQWHGELKKETAEASARTLYKQEGD